MADILQGGCLLPDQRHCAAGIAIEMIFVRLAGN
jgi:hypothetical protein